MNHSLCMASCLFYPAICPAITILRNKTQEQTKENKELLRWQKLIKCYIFTIKMQQLTSAADFVIAAYFRRFHKTLLHVVCSASNYNKKVILF